MFFQMFVKCVFLLLLLIIGINCSNYKRLQERINIIEQKQFLDSKEFREEISALVYKLNSSVSTNQKVNNKACNDEFKMSSACDQQEADDKVQQNIGLFRRALVEEKQHTRKLISKVETKMSNNLIELLDIIKDVTMKEINEMKSVQVKCGKRLEDVITTHTIIQDEMKAIHGKLDKIIELSKGTSQKLDKHVEDQKIVSNSLWHIYGASSYFTGKESMNWSEAANACKLLGAHLTEIGDSSESEFVINLAKTAYEGGSGYGAWLGGRNVGNKEIWKWEHSQTNITFTNWGADEPNGGRIENCLHLYRKINWEWNDLRCIRKMQYICERNF